MPALRPFPSTSRCEFTIRPIAGGADSEVTWTMTGTNTFSGKAFDFFANMDRMLGRDFSRGLASMKEAAESSVGTPAGARGVAGGVRSAT